ncbi:MAG: ABC transporter substrate-binding protein [Anaerolineae bacterium]|nr:ABC transporter substrate-binding protein [Anaerolineae bacterium]
MNSKLKIALYPLLVTALIVLASGCGPQTPDVIRIGGIFDLTGATRDVGIPYANGVRDCIQFLNEQGGINGRSIELVDQDYAYNIERAREVYTQLVEQDVLAIMGWGTGDTEALRQLIAADRVPFMSASYSEELTNVDSAPYNFLIGVTYSDQARIALRYILDHWTDTSRAPRVALIYNDTAFGLSHVQDSRDYAAANGIDIVDEQIVSLSATDATAELQDMATANPDYAIVQETAAAASVIAINAQELDLSTQFIYLNWGGDEKFISLAGEAAEGSLSTIPFSFITESLPGIAEIRVFNQERGVDPATRSLRYVQGWVTMRVMAEGIRRAGDDLSGEGIRAALESMSNFDPGGITAPITFSSTDHKGVTALRIHQVQNGVWVPVTDYIEAQP